MWREVLEKKNPSGSTKLVWNWSLPEGLSARGLLSAGLTAKQCINLKAMPCTDTQHLVVGFMLKMLSMKPVLKVAQTSHSWLQTRGPGGSEPTPQECLWLGDILAPHLDLSRPLSGCWEFVLPGAHRSPITPLTDENTTGSVAWLTHSSPVCLWKDFI